MDNSINKFEKEHGNILEAIIPNKIAREDKQFFANFSLPENIGVISIPKIIENKKFQKSIYKILEETHLIIKEKKRKNVFLKNKT